VDETVVAAIIGALAGLFGSIPLSFLSYRLALQKFESETRLENQLRFIITKMLLSEEWESRSFETIKGLLPGIPDDELRKCLIAAGAVSSRRKDGKEMWTHLERIEKFGRSKLDSA
jgi:hypothetical protein